LPPRSDFITGLAFAPAGKLLAVYGSAKTVSLIDPATGREVRQLKGHDKAILNAAFSADGKTLATTSEDHTCRLWNVEDGKQKGQMDTNKLQALMLSLSPDGNWIAWWDEEATINVRDLATGKQRASIKAGGAVFILDWRQSAMQFAPDGTLQALYWSRHLFQWHPEKGWKTRDFEPVSGNTAFGRIAPDGKKAVLWDWDHGTALHFFDLETGKERVVANGHLKMVRSVAAQPAGRLIASTSTDGTIRLWDLSTSRETRRWRPQSSWHPVAFFPDGKALAFGDYDGKSLIRVVHLGTNRQLLRLDTERTRALAISADGRRLLAADFTRVEVWDLARGKLLRQLEGIPETELPAVQLSSRGPAFSYTIHSLDISPDGTRAAAAFVRTGSECSVYLWDTASGKVLPGWPGPKQLQPPIAFSPDGKLLAATRRGKGSDCELVLWDVAKGEMIKRFPVADPFCHSVAFSRGGQRLAVGGLYRGVVQVYEVATAKEVVRFQAHEGPVTLTFADDGRTLITGSDDTTILIWDLRSEALRAKQ
jgi:WD40 repeat protein